MFFKIALSISSLVCFATDVTADDRSEFFAEYTPYYEKAVAHFWKNVRVGMTRKIYDTEGPGKYRGTEKVSVLCGVTDVLYRINRVDVPGDAVSKYMKLSGGRTADRSAVVSVKPGEADYNIDGTVVPWQSQRECLAYHNIHTEFSSGLHWPFQSVYIERGPNRYYPYFISTEHGTKTLSFQRGRHRGTDCITLTEIYDQRGQKTISTIHLRLPDYLVIGREREGFLQLASRSVEPIKETIEVNYGPPQPDTGLPFPTTVKGYFTTSNGKRMPSKDVVFTEYKRYTPTADELDIEKQFGVTRPPLPSPRPPLPPEGEFLVDPTAGGSSAVAARPGWPAWRLYAAAGALALAAVGLAVWVRRRSRAG